MIAVIITIVKSMSRLPGGVKKPRLVFVRDGQAIYRANALATQAKPCALDEQTGLELAFELEMAQPWAQRWAPYSGMSLG